MDCLLFLQSKQELFAVYLFVQKVILDPYFETLQINIVWWLVGGTIEKLVSLCTSPLHSFAFFRHL